MAETILNKQVFSLLEVSKSIEKTIQNRYTTAYWIKAEMNKLNHYRHSGHCYPELVQKENGKVIAQMNSILWRNDFERINNLFLQTLQEPLKDGIKLLVLAKITYDPSYGLSLKIIDIDPSYTLGDLAREKQETLAYLATHGLENKNKALPFPVLPKRIAIISVESSKGYADFIKVLEGNTAGYTFFWHLFPSILQGEKAVIGIVNQLKNIQKVLHHFDVVAIIRGGGGDIGLSCYDHLEMAKAIANFPIPVITGIGHATNFTVAEMIAHTNAITPTKLAVLLLEKFQLLDLKLSSLSQKMSFSVKEKITHQKHQIQNINHRLNLSVNNTIDSKQKEALQLKSRFKDACYFLNYQEKNKLKQVFSSLNSSFVHLLSMQQMKQSQQIQRLQHACFQLLQKQENTHQFLAQTLTHLNPINNLKRGYSITSIRQKSITSIKQITIGETIITKVVDGEIHSKIEQINKSK
jgi:exodeoxyribonuclease VII large subunit